MQKRGHIPEHSKRDDGVTRRVLEKAFRQSLERLNERHDADAIYHLYGRRKIGGVLIEIQGSFERQPSHLRTGITG
ncbi:hypothetical protein LC612_42830 [Nostoc sp. CHAB 5834]|nr:hypothetical protein [Nostoc sp. CHAB 5834]